VETINDADVLIYTTEKSLRDYGDKIGQQECGEIDPCIKTKRSKTSISTVARINGRTDSNFAQTG
jgi:hypothetical protein